MKNKKIIWIFVILILVLIIFFRYLNRYSNFSSNFLKNNSRTIEQLQQLPNNFPLKDVDNRYGLACVFKKFSIYNNYYKTPILPDNWKLLADIECQYLNVEKKAESIYIPLMMYQEKTETMFTIGTDKKTISPEIVLSIMAPNTIDEHLFRTIRGLGQIDFNYGQIILLNISYPTSNSALNNTQGLSFDSLQSSNPPYTKEDLNNFYQTGETKYLPLIDGKRYFWPLVSIDFNPNL